MAANDGKISDRTLRKEKRQEILLELFREKEKWPSQEALIDAFNKRGGELKISQSTISRDLAYIGAIEEDGKWILSAQNKNIKEFRKFFDKSQNKATHFFPKPRVLLLRVQRYRNVELAAVIKKTFASEVLATSCPNNKDIVIIARKMEDDDSLMEKEIDRLFHKKQDEALK